MAGGLALESGTHAMRRVEVTYGRTIKEILSTYLERGVTQADMARFLDVDASTISRWIYKLRL